MLRIILHIDMNSYFASVEQQANPHLRGRPIGVCEHLGGIIIAPSIEAKRLGIKLGTTVWDARKIYPKIVLLPVDPDKYRQVTRGFLKILYDYTDEVEKFSIDEAFLDITETCGGKFEDALLLGLEIKQRLRREVGEWVSASIGLGPNKLVAKIAADLGEGDLNRIHVVRPEEISSLYQKLSLTDIPGIGNRLRRALNLLGIFTLRQLANYPLENLLNQFGVLGYELHRMGWLYSPSREEGVGGGHSQHASRINYAPLLISPSRGEENPGEIKSIGHSYTLPKLIQETCDIKKLMYKLSEKIGRRMRAVGARGNVIHYFHSTPSSSPPYQGGERVGVGFHKQHKIEEFIDDGREIYLAAWRIFQQSLSFQLQIKIMGISISGLVFENPPQPLFEQYKCPGRLVAAMDAVNDKYGEFTIRRGRLLGVNREWARDTVGFGRGCDKHAGDDANPGTRRLRRRYGASFHRAGH
jgi:DNA polymerase-4